MDAFGRARRAELAKPGALLWRCGGGDAADPGGPRAAKEESETWVGREPEEFQEATFVLSGPPDELQAVHEALDKLAAEDSAAAELVKLRYFVGMTMQEATEALGLAPRTAERLWTYARAWLRGEIRKSSL